MQVRQAASLLDEALFEEIPFRKMAGLRNRVVHDYGQIDFEIVSKSVTLHLPQAGRELTAFFSTEGEAQH
jgi:uncharacterized protein with HEPN domain